MDMVEVRALLQACGHDLDTVPMLTECECEYCVTDREHAVRKAQAIKGQLKDLGWTPPKVLEVQHD